MVTNEQTQSRYPRHSYPYRPLEQPRALCTVQFAKPCPRCTPEQYSQWEATHKKVM